MTSSNSDFEEVCTKFPFVLKYSWLFGWLFSVKQNNAFSQPSVGFHNYNTLSCFQSLFNHIPNSNNNANNTFSCKKHSKCMWCLNRFRLYFILQSLFWHMPVFLEQCAIAQCWIKFLKSFLGACQVSGHLAYKTNFYITVSWLSLGVLYTGCITLYDLPAVCCKFGPFISSVFCMLRRCCLPNWLFCIEIC